jgi:nucleoside-diphosphate-sugar epimerase
MAGALGEVGRTVAAALNVAGHEVVALSSRAPIAARPEVVTLQGGLELVAQRDVDAVVSAAGRGDRRSVERTGLESTALLAAAAKRAALPSVLLSTTRVLEGWDGDVADDAEARPRTPYAEANAANEALWLESGGRSALRITNYICPPSSPTSPQTQLLPWSLVTEALETHRIGVRSGAGLAKEFVDGGDVARALTLLLGDPDAPSVCATAPGTVLTMRDLALASSDAIVQAGGTRPEMSFGPEGPSPAAVVPGWLAERGWSGALTAEALERLIREWIVAQGLSARE